MDNNMRIQQVGDAIVELAKYRFKTWILSWEDILYIMG